MQVKEVKSSGLEHEFEVNIPANDIQKLVDAELLTMGQKVKIPGFRPGKVPLNVLKQKYTRHVMADVLEKAVQESSHKLVTDKKLKPAIQPKIEVKSFDEGKDLTYTIKVEVLPDFKVMDLTKVKVEKPVADVEKKAVDEILENVAENNRDLTPIKEDRKAKKGDVLKIDFHGKRADGFEVPGMHGHDHDLELGGGQFIPGFEDQLIGTKKGDHVHVNVTFPENYNQKDLAGQEAVFHVDVKEIQEGKPAKLNDDLAKKLGLESMDALREAVEEQIKADQESYTRMKLKKNLLDILDENHNFKLPSSMVEQEHKHIIQQLERDPNGPGEGKMEDADKEELLPLAERRVRLGVVLAEIGQQEKVEVSQQELQQAVIAEARKYPGQEKMVFDYYSKNPQVLESLRAPLFEDKVVDSILEKATVTEKKVSVEDLMADDEEIPGAKGKKKSAKKSDSSSKKATDKKPAAKKETAKKDTAKKSSAKKTKK
ncbi:MAG: trigger factor [Micavibrio sp.]|nr:trigger factor [Micavibrio sp.]|tara:strand:- start:614 stop:2068 length:1455 start_codon:yes stop_codon:yes gene_type:complete